MSGGVSPSPEVRVALVGPSMDIVGGQSIVLDRLLSRFGEMPGIAVSFIAVNPRLPGPLRWLQRITYVRTIVTSVAYVATLLVRLRRVDVVHAFSASYWSFLLAPVPAMLVGRLYGKGVILNYHSGEADDHLTRWRSAKWFARLAHAIAVPSGYLVDVFRRHGLAATAIFNFVEIDRLPFRARPGVRARFLSNRNLESLYNVACTIRAFARVQAQYPDAELVVAGEGSERPRLEALVRELGLRHVQFTGRVEPSAMPALYDAADVFLNSPDIDNMPSSIIEAYAAGLPVVTTDAGGIPYIVEDGVTGLMVPAGDDEAMSRAMLRLLGEPGLAATLASQARAACLQHYVWASVGEAWLHLYRRVADAAGPRAVAAAARVS